MIDAAGAQSEEPNVCSDLVADSGTQNVKRSSKTNSNQTKSKKWVFTMSCPGILKTHKNRVEFRSPQWSAYRAEDIRVGYNKFFQCNRINLQGETSAPAIYLLYDATEEKVLHFCTTESYRSENTPLSNEHKEEIKKLFSPNIKPCQVFESLTKVCYLPIPSSQELSEYLHVLKKKSKPCKFDIGELSVCLKERSIQSSNAHASFVVAHEVLESPDEESSAFRFFISTKYLLALTKKSELIQLSTCFNLVWATYPMFVIGTTDKIDGFHPFGLFVGTRGGLEDFKFLFRSLKTALETICKIKTHPTYLLCAAEPEIQRGFKEVFGPNSVILTCWTFARKNITDLVLEHVAPQGRAKISSDIDVLQLASSNDTFQKANSLFLRKWRNETAFCKNFKSRWLGRNQNWFEGAAIGYPSTNDSLELFCNNIKRSHMFRVQFAVKTFLTKALDMVSDWSNQYKTGRRKFVKYPIIDRRLWRESYQWAERSKNIVTTGNKENLSFNRVPIGCQPSVDQDVSWKTFISYKDVSTNECRMTLPLGKEGWLRGKCNCPTFLRYSVCQHMLGIAITLKEVRVPTEIRQK